MNDGLASDPGGRGRPKATRGQTAGFPDTVWDEVRRARDRDGVVAIASVARVATRYWYPVYFLIRQKGHGDRDARDLTSSFFRSFLEHDLLACDPGDMGKFREFLVASVGRFLDPERPRVSRQPSEFAAPPPSGPEKAWRPFEPAEGETPEDAFTKNWAKTTMELCVKRLREECEAAGAGEEFAAFEARYLGDEPRDAAQIAESMSVAASLSPAEVAVILERAEDRFRRIVQEEVMTWVASPDQGLEEVTDLLATFG